MKKLSIAYFGTPYFSAQFLEKVLTDTSINQIIKVKFVVTQPDKPVGKNQVITKSPVKIIAEKYNISVYDSNIHHLELNVKNVDFALVFAYGFKQLIPHEILKSTRLKFGNTNSGFINIHPSLLPKYRGASPIAYPLLLGDNKTGVTVFVMDEKMDHGPIITQEEMEILQTDKRPDLENKLTELAFQMFKKLVSTDFNRYDPTPQEHNLSTHAPYLTKDDGFIPLSTLIKSLKNEPLSFEELPKIIKEYLQKNQKLKTFNSSLLTFNLFRGLYPWPGIWTIIQPSRLDNPVNDRTSKVNIVGKRLKITDVEYKNNQLILKKVQLEGKNEVDFETFNKAYKIF